MNATDFRERFLDSNDRFQAAMLDAIHAHQAGVVVFLDAIGKLDSLQASVDALNENDAELKTLILEQGEQLKAQGEQIRALRARLDQNGSGAQ